MYCKIKRPDNAKEPILVGEQVEIQEKLDGSNTCIYNDNGKIRYYSRSNELTGDDGLSGFVKYAKRFESKILRVLPTGWAIYGEWLNQGKINYNSLAKQGKITPYYVFDVATSINFNDTDEDGEPARKFADIDIAKVVAKDIGFEFVPILESNFRFGDYGFIKEKYVDNQKSALPNTDCIREGVVIKTLDGAKRIKIVGDNFKEVKAVKVHNEQNPYAFIDKYLTPARINKFLMEIEMSDATMEDLNKVFKHLSALSNDVIAEEKEQLLEDIARLIRKQSIYAIKEYIVEKGEMENDM